jgi:hypothetical protein
MERLMALAETKMEKLRQENGELKEEKEALCHQLKQDAGQDFMPQVKPHRGNFC